MQKIVLTGLTALGESQVVTGSEKLREFRALNTNLPNVYFADGAPLHTVHLPSSLQTLKLISADELTSVLTSPPQIFREFDENGVAIFNNPSTYRGLYIQGVTDYTSGHGGHTLSQLIIEGGNLGYGSYVVLRNLVELKNGATENKNLSISLKDVYWCPYNQV